MRREGVRNLKLERERGIKDREGHRDENACRHQRFPLKSSRVGSGPAQAMCAAGAGRTVREPENQEWERHGPRQGVPGGSSPGASGLAAPLQLPGILGSYG